ncbi:MAG TPA: transcription antitermination factor NusB [Planctomycetes bacterium]|nr:transcription antitermination factor NusB [Planctomycetota bacterium]
MKHVLSRAREAALKVLYRADMLREAPLPADIDALLAEQHLRRSAIDYARRLIEGCLAERDAIDAIIAATLDHWDLARLAAIDRAILRMAAYEIVRVKELPAGVVINEAIELAKKYSTDKSGPFVNGILDRIRATHRGEAR